MKKIYCMCNKLYTIHHRIKNIKLVKRNSLFHPKGSSEVSKNSKNNKNVKKSKHKTVRWK